jgi:LysR family transcriptional regulator, low CO2-responsive transcriptional regulator
MRDLSSRSPPHGHRAGLGIALISAHTIAAELQTGRLALLDVVSLPLLRQWFVVRHTAKRPMPAAAALWQFLVREGHLHLPSAPVKRWRPQR